MDLYKKAAKNKIRFESKRGLLTVEDLFDLSLKELDAIASALNAKIEQSKRSTLFEVKETGCSPDKIKYDIVADVFKTKQDAHNAATKAAEARAKNARIRELIAKKKDEEIAGKDIEELEALLEPETSEA